MPHLSELANKYRNDVTFVAVSDEPKEKIAKFLTQKSPFDGKTWEEAMEFTVATDPDQSTKENIFLAAGLRGIPSSFIIHDGTVQWIGHPMTMDEPLKAVVEGSWDHEEFARTFAKQMKAQAELEKLFIRVQQAAQEGDWDKAVALFDEAIERNPDRRTGLEMQKWRLLLTQAHRGEHAYELGRKLMKSNWDSASTLNELAWTVVDHENVQTRDLGFAMRAAVRASELTDLKDAAILDTLARVHYEKGNFKTALHWQRLAVEYAGEDALGDQVRETLERYLREAKSSTL